MYFSACRIVRVNGWDAWGQREKASGVCQLVLSHLYTVDTRCAISCMVLCVGRGGGFGSDRLAARVVFGVVVAEE